MQKLSRLIVPLLLAAGSFSAGCGGSSDGTQMGRLSLAVSDGPVPDAEEVCITFNEIELKRSGDESIVIELDPPRRVDLLSVQGMNAAPLLVAEELPAGDYQWMRLGVDAVRGANGGDDDIAADGDCEGPGSYIRTQSLGPDPYNLYVPSGANTGLKLIGGFTVPVNDTANFTAEFDLMKSVTAPDGLSPDVILRPTIRLVDNVHVGHLIGTVSPDLATQPACQSLDAQPAVYVFDEGVEPNAIVEGEDDPNDPIATAIVSFGDTEYEYAVGYLLAGSYNAAFTCNGTNFEPMAGKPFQIEERTITELNFP